MNDLLWYLADRSWPEPNLVLLNNALRQTKWGGGDLDASTWRSATRSRLERASWDKILTDVSPFSEPGGNLAALSRENALGLLAG